jgi:hypothetical protein
MADFRALTIQSGTNTQIQDANSLIIGAGIKTATGVLNITPAGTDVVIASGKNISLGAGGSGNIDFSASTGSFSSPTGSITLGSGAISITGITTHSANVIIATGSTLFTSGSGMINLPALFNIAGSAVGAGVTAANLNTLTNSSNADALHTHTNVSASSITVSGLTTTNLTASGQFGYISANNTLSKTDSASLSTSRSFGSYGGVSGSMSTSGVINTAQFTTVGGIPSAGSPVFLAAATDDSSTGAGKLTATPPTSGIIAEVGICIDNSNYAGAKTCKILMQVKAPVQL